MGDLNEGLLRQRLNSSDYSYASCCTIGHINIHSIIELQCIVSINYNDYFLPQWGREKTNLITNLLTFLFCNLHDLKINHSRFSSKPPSLFIKINEKQPKLPQMCLISASCTRHDFTFSARQPSEKLSVWVELTCSLSCRIRYNWFPGSRRILEHTGIGIQMIFENISPIFRFFFPPMSLITPE